MSNNTQDPFNTRLTATVRFDLWCRRKPPAALDRSNIKPMARGIRITTISTEDHRVGAAMDRYVMKSPDATSKQPITHFAGMSRFPLKVDGDSGSRFTRR